jgi:hypothetical protein
LLEKYDTAVTAPSTSTAMRGRQPTIAAPMPANAKTTGRTSTVA